MGISRSKYKTKDVGAMKFVMVCFLNYKMIDCKTAASQLQKLQVILHEIHFKGMVSSETCKVVAIIESGSFFDICLILWDMSKFCHGLILRHKSNFMGHGQSSKAKKNNNKRKGSKLGPIGGISKKLKF